jgi:hypothetical protein
MANKTARIIWAIMTRGETYHAGHRPALAARSVSCCHKQTQAPLRTEAVYERRKRAPRLQRRKGRAG